MPSAKALAIAASVIFVAATAVGWYVGTSGFNPNPSQTTLSRVSTCSVAVGDCPGFKVTSSSLTVRSAGDITSQQLSVTIETLGATSMAYIKAYLGGVSIGSVDGPFTAAPRAVSLAVPTTTAVTVGSTYTLTLEGVYIDPSTGRVTGDYVQSIVITAVGL